MTKDRSVTYKTYWLSGGWCDGIMICGTTSAMTGCWKRNPVYEGVKSEMGESNLKVGSMGMYETLEPDQERVFEFIISWYFPNRVKAWDTGSCCCADGG